MNNDPIIHPIKNTIQFSDLPAYKISVPKPMPPIHTDEKITLKKNVKLDEINLGSEDILGSIKLPFQHHSAFINICFSISPLILLYNDAHSQDSFTEFSMGLSRFHLMGLLALGEMEISFCQGEVCIYNFFHKLTIGRSGCGYQFCYILSGRNCNSGGDKGICD